MCLVRNCQIDFHSSCTILICSYTEWKILYIFSLHVDAQLFQQHLLKKLYFSIELPLVFSHRIVTIFVWVYFWSLSSLPLIHVSILLPISCCLYYCSFIVNLKIRQCESSNFVLLLKYCDSYSRSFAFPHKLQNHFVDIYEIACWDLIGILLNL